MLPTRFSSLVWMLKLIRPQVTSCKGASPMNFHKARESCQIQLRKCVLTGTFRNARNYRCKTITIAHFRVAACLSFKTSPGAQPFKCNWVAYSYANQTHFPYNSWAPRLTSKPRLTATRKWPIMISITKWPLAILPRLHTYPDIFESATFSFRIRLPSTRIGRIRWRIRNLFLIHSPELTFFNPLWIRNRVDAKSGYIFFPGWRNKIEPSSLPWNQFSRWLPRTILGNLSTRVFEKRTATGSELFSLLTCLFTSPSIFSPLEMISTNLLGTPLSWDAKCLLPVAVRVSKIRELKLPSSKIRALHGACSLISVSLRSPEY